MELITAEPHPNSSPAFSDSAGLSRISVQTVSEDQTPIVSSRLAVVFSGHTEVSVSPSTFSIALNATQSFVVTVWDREHHNPLSEATRIAFSASLGAVRGQAEYLIPDTIDKRFTSFTFRLENTTNAVALMGPDNVRVPLGHSFTPSHASQPTMPAGASALRPLLITVVVTSPNGDEAVSLSGTIDRP